MRVLIITFILCVAGSKLFCQSLHEYPVDTTYYNNGNIKRIFYLRDKEISGNPVSVIYDSLIKNKVIVDSSYIGQFVKSYKDINPTKPISSVRLYLDTNFTKIYIQKWRVIYHTGYNNIVICNSIRNKENTKYEVAILKASTKRNLYLEEEYASIFFNYPLTKKLDSLNLKINDTTSISISFIDSMNLRSFHMKMGGKNNHINNGKYAIFYNNGNLKEVGFYQGGYRIGIYKEFYESGRIKVVGHYNGKATGDKFSPIFTKYGEWIYYSDVGKIIKTEYFK